MSVLVSLLQSCPNIQTGLREVFETCAGNLEPAPFYEWVSSQMNKTDLQQQMVRGDKLKTVELTYKQRLKESETKVGEANCTATTVRGNKKTTYQLDVNDTVYAEEIISMANLAHVCQDNNSYLAQTINDLIDVVRRKMATKITTQLVGLTGKYASDVTTTNDQLVVKTLKDSDPYTPFPFTMQQIDRAAKKTGYCAPAVIFGEDLLTDYYERILAGCCATSGINLGEIQARYGKAVMYDRRVSSAFAGNTSVMTQEGALALVTWNQYEWYGSTNKSIINTGNEAIGVIVDPRTGVKMDLMVKYDCGNVHIIVTQTSKLFAMPDDMFQVGDVYEGVNFVNEILVTNV